VSFPDRRADTAFSRRRETSPVYRRFHGHRFPLDADAYFDWFAPRARKAGVTLFLGAMYVVINTGVEILQGVADPRVRV
jgi:hypothetical protein